MLRRCLPLLALLLFAPPAAADDTFPLQDGDIWVMAGDSITAQHLHSNYFEAFCYARYPKLKFAFRNSGVGGHTIPSTLQRFDYDIAAWKPTVVSVELGMNDQGGTPTGMFIKNMGTMTARIRGIKARPVILSASPINNGEVTGRLGGNKRLDEYATALKAFSETEKTPYADQFHALIDVWGKNKPNEKHAEAVLAVRRLAADKSLPGVEHLQEFVTVADKMNPAPVSMLGDAVHPGPTGQLMMAAALLKGLGAKGFVSEIVIDTDGTGSGEDCTFTDLKVDGNSVSFNRLDECLPFPIPAEARAVLPLAPEVLELSRYLLRIKRLKQGEYTLSLDGVKCGTFTAKELGDGINLTALPAGPVAAQMQAILAAVNTKENVVNTWRGLSNRAHAKGADPKLMEDLAALTKKVEEADAAIRAAAKPKTIKFEIAPK